MNSILLSVSDRVLNGLSAMLEAAIGPHNYVQPYVDVSIALLVIEAAKRADDREEWFPRGKWATIQAIQGASEKQFDRMFHDA